MSSYRKIGNLIGEASGETVEAAAAGLAAHLGGSSWLGSANRFVGNASTEVSAVRNERGGRTVRIDPNEPEAEQLAEYLAASVVLHASDGWGYLGRAIAAQLGGDIGAARHLAYYAELRAAMSLLAREGIGVFDVDHAIVADGGRAELFPHRGTHAFAWKVLESWSKTERCTDLVLSTIRPAGVALGDWHQVFTGGSAGRAQGAEYLRLWGLDLERFAEDKAARAASSYLPGAVSWSDPPSSARALEFGTATWLALEPIGSKPFTAIDLHLLRATLVQAYRAAHGATENKPQRFKNFVQNAIDGVTPSFSAPQILRVVTGADDELELLLAANNRAAIDHPENHLHICARATLLLRLATGAARDMLESAGLLPDEIRWWWHALSANRAITSPGNEPEDPIDLWDDIKAALESIAERVAGGAGADYASLHQSCARELGVLGRCERVAVLGLAA